MENIKISLQEVSNLSSSLRTINGRIYDLLQNAKQEMNSLSSIWDSDGSDTIRQRFNLFGNKFEDLKIVIDSYARFLDNTVSSYDSLENTINANASSFN